MKIVVLIAALALGGYLFTRQKAAMTPRTTVVVTAPSAPAATANGPAATPTALRRPIVKTHETLDQVKARNGDGEF